VACAPSANQMIVPGPACDAGPTLLGSNFEVAQETKAKAACKSSLAQGFQSTPLLSIAYGSSADPASQRMLLQSGAPAFQSTPLQSAAALYQAVTQERKEDTSTEVRTTLILRNIPTTFTRSMVMRILGSEGFAKDIAFMYLPMNLRSSGNFGYAFVDFDCTYVAEQCKNKLDGFTGWSGSSEKLLEVDWSDSQGIDCLVQRYRDSPLMHESLEDEFKPALFKNGVRIAFPPPTKPIRAPRLRREAYSAKQ